eukprot:3897457-Pyramimonas_sp.AAC.1
MSRASKTSILQRWGKGASYTSPRAGTGIVQCDVRCSVARSCGKLLLRRRRRERDGYRTLDMMTIQILITAMRAAEHFLDPSLSSVLR